MSQLLRRNASQHSKGTLALSWGPWGGFYLNPGYSKRLCVGWLAITYVPVELDDMMEAYVSRPEMEKTIRRAYRQLTNTEIHCNSQWVNQALETLRASARGA
jgi:hypothetical protein